MTDQLLILDSLAKLKSQLLTIRKQGHKIALVPTMGNLHDGHIALIKAALKHGNFVLATIFVNPLQFGPNEDLDRYPRTFSQDCEALAAAGAHGVFVPSVNDMYPDGIAGHSSIHVPGVSALYCGKSRPGHFDGVCTVVCKLFNMTQPDVAVFGLKDYQQFHIIKKMTRDLQLPVELVGIPTVREETGLALSSRNGYLDPQEKAQALALNAGLQAVAKELKGGNRNFDALEQQAGELISQAGLTPDYLTICNQITLMPASPSDTSLVVLAAAYAGTTRLIDNIQILISPGNSPRPQQETL